MQFDLLTNPFAVLGLTGDASVGDITARARDLGTAPAAAASRTLLAPRTRLPAELSFLPGASRYLVDTCLDALKAKREPDAWSLTPSARANLLAHRASGRTATAKELCDLVGLQDAIRSTTGKVIDKARQQAKMPPVPQEMLDAALTTLASRHAEAFAEGMLALPTGADLFAEQLRATAPDATARLTFMREAAAAWDRATASEAAQELENAANIEETLRIRPNTEAAAQLAAVVLRFARRTKPPREACRLVGLPHQASLDAARRWHAVAIDLNNRQDAVLEAVTVLEALTDGFGTADEFGVRTARDLAICRDRLNAGEGTPEVRRLVAAIAAATEKDLSFQHEAELRDAFVAAARAARSDLPWRLLRDFAQRLHNEFSATADACNFTRLAIEAETGKANASDVIRQLRLDLQAIRKRQLSIELAAADRTKQRTAARRLLTELVTLTDNNSAEQAFFQAELRKLKQQQTVLLFKYGLCAAVGLVFVLLLTANGHKPITPGSTNYLSSASSYGQSAPGYAAPATPAPVDPDAGHPERQPVPGTATLTRAELRWCRYQDARQQAASDYLEAYPAKDVDQYNAGVSAYNAFIAPINATCGSYKYWPADGSVIDAELNLIGGTLKAEGQRLIANAYQAAVLPAPKNPSVVRPPPFSQQPTQPPAVAASTAYAQGRADRQNWESWIRGLTGASRDGAEWWAGARSTPRPPTCDRVPGPDHAMAVAGCSAAQSRLANVDRRRRAEPDYRIGWNNQ